MIVCQRGVVSDRAINTAVAEGARTVSAVCRATGAGQDCGFVHLHGERLWCASIGSTNPRSWGWTVQPVSPRVVELLNEALTFELTVTNGSFLHARMLDNWGLGRLGRVCYACRRRDAQRRRPDQLNASAQECHDLGDHGTAAVFESFQGKVQTYVSFALDGQLATQFPEAEGRPWRIVVACESGPPDPKAQHVLDALGESLPQHGGSPIVR